MRRQRAFVSPRTRRGRAVGRRRDRQRRVERRAAPHLARTGRPRRRRDRSGLRGRRSRRGAWPRHEFFPQPPPREGPAPRHDHRPAHERRVAGAEPRRADAALRAGPLWRRLGEVAARHARDRPRLPGLFPNHQILHQPSEPRRKSPSTDRRERGEKRHPPAARGRSWV